MTATVKVREAGAPAGREIGGRPGAADGDARSAGLRMRSVAVVSADPSDAELLRVLASLLAAVPGPVCQARLSALVAYVCTTCGPAASEAAGSRAQRLQGQLAVYLHERHVLRAGQATPEGLDAWAAGTPVVVLHAAVAACARRETVGGGR